MPGLPMAQDAIGADGVLGDLHLLKKPILLNVESRDVRKAGEVLKRITR